MTPNSQSQDQAVIRTRGLARAFGPTVAVASLDIEVLRGEMYGLVGPVGAGKSTAIRLLCGILQPTGGEGHVLGHDLRTEAEAVKARIGYLSQNFTLYGDLTVDENLEFFAAIHGVRDAGRRRDELLQFTRLTPFRRRLAQALSGGMKKKLALACTLIHTPELILLDEPSTGVDPVSRGEFWNILSGILAEGVTIVMTTPYLDEVDRCHRIGLMHQGRIIRTGTPAQVKACMPGRLFQLECPAPAAAYRALRRRWNALQLVLYADRLHLWTSGGDADAREAVDILQHESLGPVTLQPAEPSMEDVFVALLGTPGEPRKDT